MSPTQQVREQLLAAIQAGEYAPGELLPSERALCDMFGVSRVSVREAIAGLEATGIVEVQHGRGSFVAQDLGTKLAVPFGLWLGERRDQVVELLKVRGALDEVAAAEAASRTDSGAVAAIARAHAEFERAVHGSVSDVKSLVQLDIAFHEAIARAADLPLLSRLLSELVGHTADSRSYTLSVPGQPSRSSLQHGAILAAIEAGNAAAARRGAAEHVAAVIDQVRET